MVGFAPSPGTEVLPVCSMPTTLAPSASTMLARSVSNRAGHEESYGWISTSMPASVFIASVTQMCR